MLYRLDCKWACALDARSDTGQVNRSIMGKVWILVNKESEVDIRYKVAPLPDATGNLLECGITLRADSNYNTFRWIGAGPFSSTIGKTAFNERGLYALDKNDIRFNGNRSEVDLAAVCSGGSVSLGLYPGNGCLGVENENGHILISQNAIITGYGSKFKAPKGRLKIKDIKSIQGELIVFVSAGRQERGLLNEVFHPDCTVNPENPFMESYGW
jgi:beta-galactosidase